jgi:hypothetical protein
MRFIDSLPNRRAAGKGGHPSRWRLVVTNGAAGRSTDAPGARLDPPIVSSAVSVTDVPPDHRLRLAGAGSRCVDSRG